MLECESEKKQFQKLCVGGRGMRAHDACVGQRRTSDPLELEMVVSHPLWVLGPKFSPL